jgi:hypothetical protein
VGELNFIADKFEGGSSDHNHDDGKPDNAFDSLAYHLMNAIMMIAAEATQTATAAKISSSVSFRFHIFTERTPQAPK